MDTSSFYAILSGICFTLVGLWWMVVQARPAWRRDPLRRRLAGGTYLSFLLPGAMALFAQVNPETPLLWRVSFACTAALGLATTIRLIGVESTTMRGPFRRFRWVVVLIYALILVLGAVPEMARLMGFAPLHVAGFLLVLLVLIGHGLTWEFLMEPDETS